MRTQTLLYILFALSVSFNVMTWFSVREVQSRWLNVPPAPSYQGAVTGALGDSEFAYRQNGILLQNLGNTGGRFEALQDYDYNALYHWFFLQEQLNPVSRYTKFLVAFYFGAVQDPSKLPPVIEYLRRVGNNKSGETWRWLGQAVYLARYKMKNLDLALELSRELAAIDNPDMPAWTRQMPALILNAKGDKEEATVIMMELLKSDVDNMHPNEVNFTKEYICTRLLDPEEAARHDLCQDFAGSQFNIP